jgi:ubiquinone/menaquinone biosynthesis C-methylase UbiE
MRGDREPDSWVRLRLLPACNTERYPFCMPHRVCPWWLGYLLASPLRKWMGQDAIEIPRPYVREGMTVLEPGPGMGFFTIPFAKLVGPPGRVVAVDLEPKMIASLKRRAAKATVLDRVDARTTMADTLGIGDLAGKIDFTLAFAVVHEVPDPQKFFREVAAASKSGARVLFAEPSGHVDDKKFEDEIRAATAAGFTVSQGPIIRRSLSALLVKK